MSTYIVLLGPPGSGKGTQAKILEEKLGLPHVSTGDLFRAMKSLDTPLARRVQDTMAQGGLISDEITIEMVKDRLSQPDCNNGAILDGFPRTLGQAEALDELLGQTFGSKVSLAPLFDVNTTEAIRRIMGRSKQQSRDDDRKEVAETRSQIYLRKTAPVIDFYEAKGVLVRLDASGSIQVVTETLLNAITGRLGIGRADGS